MRHTTLVLCDNYKDLARVRVILRLVLAESIPVSLTNDILLVVSELITNGLKHGQGPVNLSLEVDGVCVYLEVDDSGTTFFSEKVVPPPLEKTAGRGLMLVKSLTSSCQISQDHFGTHVRTSFVLSE